MEKGLLLEEEEEAGVTLANLTGVAVVVVAVVAIESPQVEFGTMEMTFVSSVNQGTQPDLVAVAQEKEMHAPSGSPKLKCLSRLYI